MNIKNPTDNENDNDNLIKKKSSSNVLREITHSNTPQNYSILDEFSF